MALFGCSSSPDEVDFASFSGTANDFSDCHCQYEDGTNDTPSIQILCQGGGEIESMSMFIDPTVTGPQGAELIFLATLSQWIGGGTGTFGTLGAEHRDAPEIVRSIDGLDFTWADQVACDSTHGCLDADTMYHLAAGAAHVGRGQCEDLEATISDDLP